MNTEDTLSEIQEIMRDIFDLDDLVITDNTSAEDIEEWDSLSHVRLIVAIEQKFRFKFTNKEIESLKHVGDLVKVVHSKAG